MIRSATYAKLPTPRQTSASRSFAEQWAALLTTFRRDGRPVGTPVNVVVDGDRIAFRTYAQSGKFKRLRNNPRVTLQPCDARGHLTGELVLSGEARLLHGADELRAGRTIDGKYPFFQRRLVRLAHRLARYRTVHFEIVPTDVRIADCGA